MILLYVFQMSNAEILLMDLFVVRALKDGVETESTARDAFAMRYLCPAIPACHALKVISPRTLDVDSAPKATEETAYSVGHCHVSKAHPHAIREWNASTLIVLRTFDVAHVHLDSLEMVLFAQMWMNAMSLILVSMSVHV